MKKYILLAAQSSMLISFLIHADGDINALTRQLQHLQTESKAVLKAWQRAKIQENLLTEPVNQELKNKLPNDKTKHFITAAEKFSKAIKEQTTTAVKNIINSHNFKNTLSSKTNEDVEKIADKGMNFQDIKGDTRPEKLFTSPALTSNKTTALLYKALANTSYYQLLWQKMTAKEKELAAKITALKAPKEAAPITASP